MKLIELIVGTTLIQNLLLCENVWYAIIYVYIHYIYDILWVFIVHFKI